MKVCPFSQSSIIREFMTQLVVNLTNSPETPRTEYLRYLFQLKALIRLTAL